MARPQPTGRELHFGEDEIIVSKTDLQGRITYANDVFQRVSGYTERELLGAPHSILRHPDMPRSVFSLLWSRIQAGKEIFAYVVNLARNGDHYWVLAHVTPSFTEDGTIVGYHSNRRVPDRQAIDTIVPLYRELLAIEARATTHSAGIGAATAALEAKLQKASVSYDAFVFSL